MENDLEEMVKLEVKWLDELGKGETNVRYIYLHNATLLSLKKE